MFDKFQKFWNKNGFTIVVLVTLLFISIYSLFRIGKGGTWTQNFQYVKPLPKTRRPPQESKGELECRRVLEELFGEHFSKARPDFLNNPVTGGNFNLELDCFSSSRRIAVEYNGIQHYKYIPYFHKNYEAFTNQKYRDYMKRKMCEENKVILIEVPYTVKVEDIKKYLMDKFRELSLVPRSTK